MKQFQVTNRLFCRALDTKIPQALDGKLYFLHIIKCQSINYNSVKFQVDRLRNKKVTIYRSALSYKQEGASLRHLRGWSGGAVVLGKLPVPGLPTNLE